MEMKLVLRPDQEEAKRALYQSVRDGNKCTVLQAMTSFGKTALAAQITLDALSRGKEVIFTAPMITLVEQTAHEFYKFGIEDIGIIQADHPATNLDAKVQICSIQSIQSILKKDPEFWQEYQKGKIIIHDECHLQYKAQHMMNFMADSPVFGLSATPWAKGMAKHWDHLVQGPSTKWLIENGHLSPYRAYSHYVPDMKGVQVSASGDYNSKEAGEKYDKKIIGDIVKTWEKHAKGRKTILFAPRVVDAERFAEEFRRSGYRAVSVSGYMDQEECGLEVERFRNGEYDVIASVAKLATGFSVRDVGCIVDAQPTQSLMRAVQKWGRALRTHPDKEDAIILDNAGNIPRNGLPDDEFPDLLDDGKPGNKTDRKKKEDPLPKPCPSCNYLKPPKVNKCPACGFEAKTQSQLQVEAGELVEIGRAKAQKKLNKSLDADQKREIFGGLKWIARERGYKPGWAAHAYRSITGVWPNKYKDAEPVKPSADIIEFVENRRRA